MASKSLGTLTLDLIAKIGGFEQGMDRAGRAAERNFKKMRKEAQDTGNLIGKVLAFATAGAGFATFIKNTVDAQNEQAQLAAVLRSTGEAAGYSQNQLNDMAAALAKTSTLSAGEITQAQTTLLAFTGIVGEEFPRALRAAVDMASRTGMSVVSAAETIGRALDVPSKGLTALSRQGFRFTDEQKRMAEQLEATGRTAEAQGIILTALEESYGGAAQAARDTFGGAIKAVQEALNDLFQAGPGQIDPVTDSLNELADVLRDPATVKAARDLAGAIITTFSAASKVMRETVSVARWVGEEIAAAVHGAATDDIVRLERQLENLQTARGRNFASQLVDGWTDAELDKAIATTKAKIDAYYKWQDDRSKKSRQQRDTGGAGAASAESGAPAIDLPSKEFEKLAAKLREQVALYGQVGEAAKIRYQIESGALKDLKPGEAEQLIRLAEQYDARVKVVKALQEQEQAAKQLQVAYDGRLEQYARELALSGQITELERLRYDITRGALVGINAEQQKRLEGLAKEVDALKERKALEQALKGVVESLRTEQEAALDNYIEKMNTLNAALREGVISQDAYAEAVRRAKKELDDMADSAKGAAEDMSVYMEQAARNMQSALADFLFDPFDEGLEGMLKNFGRILQRMAAEIAAAKIFEAIGSWGSANTGSGGWMGAIASFASAFAGAKDGGGLIPSGQWGIVGERGPEIVQGPAHVTSRMDTAKALGGTRISVGQMVFPNVRNAAEATQAAGAAARQLSRLAGAGQRYS